MKRSFSLLLALIVAMCAMYATGPFFANEPESFEAKHNVEWNNPKNNKKVHITKRSNNKQRIHKSRRREK